MGACASSSATPPAVPIQVKKSPAGKKLTFGKDANLKREDFIASKLSLGDKVIRRPGELKGYDFKIDDCESATCLLFDRSAAVNASNLKDCLLFVGPCEGSLYLRNSTRCTVVACVRQLRLYGCKDCDIILYAATEPVIEESLRIRLGCWNLVYDALQTQLSEARLSRWENRWCEVHDFTNPNAKVNWSIMSSTYAQDAAAKALAADESLAKELGLQVLTDSASFFTILLSSGADASSLQHPRFIAFPLREEAIANCIIQNVGAKGVTRSRIVPEDCFKQLKDMIKAQQGGGKVAKRMKIKEPYIAMTMHADPEKVRNALQLAAYDRHSVVIIALEGAAARSADRSVFEEWRRRV